VEGGEGELFSWPPPLPLSAASFGVERRPVLDTFAGFGGKDFESALVRAGGSAAGIAGEAPGAPAAPEVPAAPWEGEAEDPLLDFFSSPATDPDPELAADSRLLSGAAPRALNPPLVARGRSRRSTCSVKFTGTDGLVTSRSPTTFLGVPSGSPPFLGVPSDFFSSFPLADSDFFSSLESSPRPIKF
jgi:hypothetical protein